MFTYSGTEPCPVLCQYFIKTDLYRISKTLFCSLSLLFDYPLAGFNNFQAFMYSNSLLWMQKLVSCSSQLSCKDASQKGCSYNKLGRNSYNKLCCNCYDDACRNGLLYLILHTAHMYSALQTKMADTQWKSNASVKTIMY